MYGARLFILLAAVLLPAQVDERRPVQTEECNQATTLIGQGKWTEALHLIENLVGREPTSIPALRSLLLFYDRSNQWDTGLSYLERLLRDNPNNGLVHFGLGLALRIKDAKAAQYHFQSCVHFAPHAIECYERLAESYAAQKNLPAGVGEFKSLVAAGRSNPEAYTGLSSAYRQSGRLQDALKAFYTGLNAVGAGGSPDQLANYLEYGARLVSAPETRQALLEAAPLFRDALKLFDTENNRERTLETRFRLAYCLRGAGQFDAAITELKDLDVRSSEVGNYYWGGMTQKLLAAIDVTRGSDQAADHLTKAIRMFQELGDAAETTSATQMLGNVFQLQGDYQGAIATYSRSMTFRSAGSEFFNAYALRLIGNAYGELGDHWKELDHHARSVKAFQAMNELHTAGAGLGSVGSAYFSLGDYEKAEFYFKEALASAATYDDLSEQERNLANLGELYLRTQDYVQAQKSLEKALSFADNVITAGFKAEILISLGEVYARGPAPNYPRAIDNCKRGLDLAQSLGARATEGAAFDRLGEILLRARDPYGAEGAFRKALAIGEASELQDTLWVARKGLGEVLIDKGELEAALNQLETALQTLESIRSAIPSPDMRSGFLEDKLEVYEDVLDVLFRLHQRNPNRGYDRIAFRYAEQGRGRAFLETLAEARANVRKGLTAEQAARRARLLIEYSRAASAFRDQNSAETHAALTGAATKLELFVAEVRGTSPAYRDLVVPPAYTADQAQRDAARHRTTMVAYSLGRRQSLGWLISPSAVRMFRLPARSVIESQVHDYRQKISTAPRNEHELTAYIGEAQELWRTLLAPVGSALATSRNLVIVPDGMLSYLPFETLMRAEADGRPKFLAEDLTVLYAPSAAIFGFLSGTRRPAGSRPMDLLAYGDPERVGAKDKTSSDRSIDSVDAVRAARGVLFPRLPGSRNEVLSIGNYFPPQRQTLHLGRDASEGSLKHEDLRRYETIHFATHTVIDERFPARSGVVLSLADGDGKDGVLQIDEILNLEMNTGLVVLSACKSDLGRMVRGEGVMGLTRAFFYAGAEGVAASLWPVSDRSTSEFMKAFYKGLARRVHPGAALRDAKLEMINSPVTAYHHPYYWAPFILHGSF